MKLNFAQLLINLDGVPFADGDCRVSLGDVCFKSLESAYTDEPTLSGAEKYARFELMARIKGAADLDVSSEDITKLKHLIGKCYSVPVVGAAYDALEGKSRRMATPPPAAAPSSAAEQLKAADAAEAAAPRAKRNKKTAS